GRHLGVHALGNTQVVIRVHGDLRRVRPRRLMPSDTVADGEALHALARLGDATRALGPDDMRVLHRVHARTTIRVDEVHARGLDVDEHLTGPGNRALHRTELEDLGSTGFHRTNCLGHDASCI